MLLQKPTGRFTVSVMDLEWYDNENITNPSRLSSILVRLFYPIAQVDENSNNSSNNDNTTENSSPSSMNSSTNFSYWFPDSSYYPCYGYYMGIPKILGWPLFYWFAGGAKIWALNEQTFEDETDNNDPSHPSFDSKPSLEKFPFLIFSHGLGGIRTTYSTICTELASHGCIIAALEHRDGSASMTIEQNLKMEKTVKIYQSPPSPLFTSSSTNNQFQKDGDRQEEIKDGERRGIIYSFRNDQLKWRSREVVSTLNFFTNKEKKDQNGKKDEENVKILMGNKEILEKIKNKIDPERMGLIGHSFGAATGILAAHIDQRIKILISLDPWLYALPKELKFIQIPLLIISSETFDWPGNNELVREFNENCKISKRIIIPGSAHMDQSDIPLIMPSFLMGRFRKGADVTTGKAIQMNDPIKIIKENLNLITSFLRENKII